MDDNTNCDLGRPGAIGGTIGAFLAVTATTCCWWMSKKNMWRECKRRVILSKVR